MGILNLTNGESLATFRAALNTMFGELYANFPLIATAKITAAAAGTAVHVIPAASIPAGKKFYLTGILLNVNGGTAWTDVTATKLTVQDTNGSPVSGIVIPKALLTGNAILDSLATATLTVGNAILQGIGFTTAKGIDIVGDANFLAGDDIYVTLFGYVA
jgi:hypothetical protein